MQVEFTQNSILKPESIEKNFQFSTVKQFTLKQKKSSQLNLTTISLEDARDRFGFLQTTDRYN